MNYRLLILNLVATFASATAVVVLVTTKAPFVRLGRLKLWRVLLVSNAGLAFLNVVLVIIRLNR